MLCFTSQSHGRVVQDDTHCLIIILNSLLDCRIQNARKTTRKQLQDARIMTRWKFSISHRNELIQASIIFSHSVLCGLHQSPWACWIRNPSSSTTCSHYFMLKPMYHIDTVHVEGWLPNSILQTWNEPIDHHTSIAAQSANWATLMELDTPHYSASER